MKISINKLSDAYVFEQWDVWTEMLGIEINNSQDADVAFSRLKIINGKLQYT